MLRVQSFLVFCRFTHDVLIGSFSDMIFLLWVCDILFLLIMLYISCLDVCYAFNMRHIFTYTSWSFWPNLSWKILSLLAWDQRFDLRSSRLWPISHSNQSSTVFIPISWLFRLVDLPILSLTWHYPWYRYMTLLPFFALSCCSTIAFPFHHFLDLTR